MTADLTDPMFTDENAARVALEAIRWPSGPVCAHCGSTQKIGAVNGKSHRPGLYYCGDCKGQFTVTVGSVFERSKIPLTKWLLATHLLSASKKGMSSHQLHRMLGVTYKTAWFMSHRIREAMAPLDNAKKPMGGTGKIVEADETEITPSRKTWKATRIKRSQNTRFVALIERGGSVRSKVIDERGMGQVRQAVRENLAPGTILHTDGAQVYKLLMPIGQHEAVDHKTAFARDSNNGRVHTNSAEGYFSIFKRGLVGTYQHIGEQHLARYLAEFDFRMNNRAKLGINDAMRAAIALKGAEGKRLTYQQTNSVRLS
ncbi:MAG: IS1595 family transposase [Acidocella sp.]|nr:IS1595 family transposase [Acidocella sp.]